MPSAKHRAAKGSRGRAPERTQRARKQDDEREATRARAFWSGTLSFGLVSIPVELHPATRSARTALRMLGPDGAPLARRYFCPEHDEEVPDDELARGYERASGEHVLVDDEELEALAPDKSRDIDLRRFVDPEAIDPLYFERAYVLAPSGDSTKAYRLLAAVMARDSVAGIATFVMRDRAHVVAIFADGALLRAQTLRFANELRDGSALGVPARNAAKPEALRAWRAALRRRRKQPFDPKLLRDDAAEKLRELAENKHERGQDVFVREQQRDEAEAASVEIFDLLEVLKRSLRERQRERSP